MSAILFMLRKSIKNTILELIHHPLKLILYIFVIGMIVFSGVVNMTEKNPDRSNQDIRMLEGIYLGVLLLVAVPTLFSGMNSGATFFKMSDVCMLFVSPISSKKILLYGIIKQMSTTLLVALFMLSYAGLAVTMFGITPAQAIVLLLGFGAITFIMQLVTMTVYSFVNGNEKRIQFVKFILYVILGAAVVFAGLQIKDNGLSQDSIFAAISAPQLEYIPFAGWVKGMLFGFIKGDVSIAVLYALITLAGVLVCLILFLRSDADYYEDVLQNTESTYEMKQSAKEGRSINMNGSFAKKKFKVGNTGLNGGWGASAFFFKQMREIKRRSRLVFISGSTVLLLAACVFMGFILNNVKDDGETISSNIAMMACTIMCVYILFFLNAAGEWSRELMKPYLYMVPESPFKKLVWASLTSLIKPVVEGIIVFTAAGIVLKANVLTIIICVLLYASFGFIFTASNVLSQRVLGQMANKGLIMVLYMLMLMLLVAPGIAIGAILVFCVPGMPKVVMGIPVFLWNTAVSAGIYALCKNTLHNMEIM